MIQDGARYHTSAVMNEFFEVHKVQLTDYNQPFQGANFLKNI